MTQRRPPRTLGPGHDEFWKWCNEGELRLPSCDQCSNIAWPIVPVCEKCGGEHFTWRRMSGHGKIVSWCTFEYDYYRGTLPLPYETILVELDEGPLFISNPVDLTWRDITFEMPVNLTFIACEDTAGTYQLPVFEKA